MDVAGDAQVSSSDSRLCGASVWRRAQKGHRFVTIVTMGRGTQGRKRLAEGGGDVHHPLAVYETPLQNVAIVGTQSTERAANGIAFLELNELIERRGIRSPQRVHVRQVSRITFPSP